MEQRQKSGAASQALFAEAAVMAKSAAERYRRLATFWQEAGEATLAGLFTQLAELKAAESARYAVPEGAAAPPASGVTGTTPGHGIPAESEWRTSLLTPYRALSLAVRAEEQAFAHFARRAAEAEDEATRTLAEDLAHAALDRAAELRLARRAAFRAEGGRRPALPATLAELAEAEKAWEEEERTARGEFGRLRALNRRLDRYLEIAANGRDAALVEAAQKRAEALIAELAEHRARQRPGEGEAGAGAEGED